MSTIPTFQNQFGTEISIRIPVTALDWEIYSRSGCGLSARRLTGALKRSFAEFIRVFKSTKDLNKAILAADGVHAEARNARSNTIYGSCDTEPRYQAQQVICDFARAYTGNQNHSFYHLF